MTMKSRRERPSLSCWATTTAKAAKPTHSWSLPFSGQRPQQHCRSVITSVLGHASSFSHYHSVAETVKETSGSLATTAERTCLAKPDLLLSKGIHNASKQHAHSVSSISPVKDVFSFFVYRSIFWGLCARRIETSPWRSFVLTSR